MHVQVLQSLTQQLLTERSEKKELMEMLEQEGKELQCVIADKEELEKRLQEVHQKVAYSHDFLILISPFTCMIDGNRDGPTSAQRLAHC